MQGARAIGCNNRFVCVCGREEGDSSSTSRLLFLQKGYLLLTEQQISNSWSQILRSTKVDADLVARAEALIDQLRPESPLRHRLDLELEELRKLSTQSAAG
jgi:hypothetical protein